MRTIPEYIADALVFFGVIPKPQAPLPVNVVHVEPAKHDDTVYSSVRNGETYDADDEFIQAARPQFTPFDFTKDVDNAGNKYEVSATLYEVDPASKSYKLRRIDGRANVVAAMVEAESKWMSLDNPALNPRSLREASAVERDAAIREAADRARAKLLEDDAFANDAFRGGSQSQSWAMGDRYGDGIDANAEYIPLMGGPYSKQLYLYQYLDMHRKAFEAYNHNPVAHQLVELQTAFVLGRGLDHQCTNDDVEAVWREFVERTDFYQDLENIANDLWWQGEMMMEFYDNDPGKGFTDYRMIDPSTVWDIITDPEDIQKVFYYHQQYSTPMQMYVKDDIQMTKYIIRQIPDDQVLHRKINVSKYEKRGRSDLFSILGWVKRLKDLMNARVIKGQLEAAFVFDIEINAGDAQVAQANMQLPDPFKPGSNWVHNKNAQMKPVQSGLKANESEPDVSALLNLIAVGFGVPKEFIGEAGKGARAGALVATEPGTKRFEKRQRLIESIVYAVADRVITNAVKAGRLDIDKAMVDARSVEKLAKRDADLPHREDVHDEMEQKQEDADQQAQDMQQQQMQFNNKLTVMQAKQSHELAVNDQKNMHRQNLASIKNTKTTHKITTNNNMQEASLRAAVADNDNGKLTPQQKDRVDAIKKSGKFAHEFLEFTFPSIAQEDRSAKLKDLALAEAMQWLPKSVSATMAAKELNITTYSFEEAWAQIVEESGYGYSIAHVYGQDNQHTPETTIAQDVQAELAAKQPIPAQNQMTNVPVPPTVSGDKLMPAQPKGAGGGGSVPPGQKPNSGSTKVNKFSGQEPNDTDPTAKAHGYSAAGNHPMTGEGRARIIKSAREARIPLGQAIHAQLLREALGPVISTRAQLAQAILANQDAVQELLREFSESA